MRKLLQRRLLPSCLTFLCAIACAACEPTPPEPPPHLERAPQSVTCNGLVSLTVSLTAGEGGRLTIQQSNPKHWITPFAAGTSAVNTTIDKLVASILVTDSDNVPVSYTVARDERDRIVITAQDSSTGRYRFSYTRTDIAPALTYHLITGDTCANLHTVVRIQNPTGDSWTPPTCGENQSLKWLRIKQSFAHTEAETFAIQSIASGAAVNVKLTESTFAQEGLALHVDSQSLVIPQPGQQAKEREYPVYTQLDNKLPLPGTLFKFQVFPSQQAPERLGTESVAAGVSRLNTGMNQKLRVEGALTVTKLADGIAVFQGLRKAKDLPEKFSRTAEGWTQGGWSSVKGSCFEQQSTKQQHVLWLDSAATAQQLKAQTNWLKYWKSAGSLAPKELVNRMIVLLETVEQADTQLGQVSRTLDAELFGFTEGPADTREQRIKSLRSQLTQLQRDRSQRLVEFNSLVISSTIPASN